MVDAGPTDNHTDTDGRAEHTISHDISGCLASRIGRHGLTTTEHASGLQRVDSALAGLRTAFRDGRLPFLTLCQEQQDLVAAHAALQRLSAGAGTIIFLGTGSVCVAAEALAQVAGWNIPGTADPAQKNRPRTRFYDNLDPRTLRGMLSGIDLTSTRFVFLMADGGNQLSLAQALVVVSTYDQAGLSAKLPDVILGITQVETGETATPLRALLSEYDISALDLPAGVDGAFAILSCAALLPAMARGLDAGALRNAAAATLTQVLSQEPGHNSGVLNAAATIHALVCRDGLRSHVIMPFADRLQKLAVWSADIWLQTAGQCAQTPTPVAALGPRDSQSLLPHLLQGHRGQLVTLWDLPSADIGPVIHSGPGATPDISALAGRSIGDLVASHHQTLAEELVAAGRPVRSIHISEPDERGIGALIMHTMLEALLFAEQAKSESSPAHS